MVDHVHNHARSFVDDLAALVSKKLGRDVRVSREKVGSKTDYHVSIPGAHPEYFGPMTVGQCKRVLAMFSDLLTCEVILPNASAQ